MRGELKASDRVLVLGIEKCPATRLREWATALSEGFLVGVGPEEEVRALRRELAELDNAMFTVGDRWEIPWRDAFFTLILDVEGSAQTPEMKRVLAAGGRVSIIET